MHTQETSEWRLHNRSFRFRSTRTNVWDAKCFAHFHHEMQDALAQSAPLLFNYGCGWLLCTEHQQLVWIGSERHLTVNQIVHLAES